MKRNLKNKVKMIADEHCILFAIATVIAALILAPLIEFSFKRVFGCKRNI